MVTLQLNTIDNSTSRDADEPDLSACQITVAVCYLLLAVLIVPVNSVVIGNILTEKSLHVPMNWFVGSLCVADFLFGAVVIPMSIAYLVSRSAFADVGVCMFSLCITTTITVASVVNLIGITVDRFIAIKHTLKYLAIMTNVRAAIIIVCQWGFAILYGFAPAMGWNNISSNSSDTFTCEVARITTLAYSLFAIFVIMLPTVTFVFITFYVTLAAARRQRRRIEATRVSTVRRGESCDRIDSKSMKITKTLFLVVILFYVFWVPFGILREVRFILIYNGDATPSHELEQCEAQLVLSVFAYSTALINPLIYSYGNRDLRTVIVRNLVRWKKCCRSPASPSPSRVPSPSMCDVTQLTHTDSPERTQSISLSSAPSSRPEVNVEAACCHGDVTLPSHYLKERC
ncbi:adenosine receptor A1-like [Saccoglossus kowalevskii]|uniref:Adenosine receptor A2a-like n=1 Tax=Saccoglossus kowalevskii TaxID=10224 RepID=A0ABM0MYV4_SACKO|nr:PREDICTED: adenosine receptor A2a-like [Saccoglossus kowalevskii]